MTVQISDLAAEAKKVTFSDDEAGVVTPSPEFLQQQAAKAGYDAAKARWDKVIPANPNAPVGPLLSPAYQAPAVAPAVPTEEPYYAAHATDLMLPSSERRGSGLPWGTIGIVAGVVGVVGLVSYMMFKPTRGFNKPAMAGLHGRRRRRHRR